MKLINGKECHTRQRRARTEGTALKSELNYGYGEYEVFKRDKREIDENGDIKIEVDRGGSPAELCDNVRITVMAEAQKRRVHRPYYELTYVGKLDTEHRPTKYMRTGLFGRLKISNHYFKYYRITRYGIFGKPKQVKKKWFLF